MSFICPFCGCTTTTRTSDPMSARSRRGYHQCNNICCGATFTTLQEVEHIISRPQPAIDDATKRAIIRPELFVSRHYKAAQMLMNFD